VKVIRRLSTARSKVMSGLGQVRCVKGFVSDLVSMAHFSARATLCILS